ncbi:MAG: hypothetical protein ACFFCI_01040 [Promethearchaeota archaeon]
MMMTRTIKKKMSHENHINGKKNQQQKTQKKKIMQKEVPLDVAMALEDIEEQEIQFVCKKYHLVD